MEIRTVAESCDFCNHIDRSVLVVKQETLRFFYTQHGPPGLEIHSLTHKEIMMKHFLRGIQFLRYLFTALVIFRISFFLNPYIKRTLKLSELPFIHGIERSRGIRLFLSFTSLVLIDLVDQILT